MAGRKVEGNTQQRRRRARDARQRGRAPSAEGATTGASKQRHHLKGGDDPVERMQTRQEGKQRDPGIDVDDQPSPRTRRWHRDHGHDPQSRPQRPGRDAQEKMP